jgi:hypothetical protein
MFRKALAMAVVRKSFRNSAGIGALTRIGFCPRLLQHFYCGPLIGAADDGVAAEEVGVFDPPIGRKARGPALLQLENLFQRLMKTIAGTVFCHEVVVANMGEHGSGRIGRMNHHTHALFEGHRFVVSNQRALDQIVSLRVGVHSRLGRHILLFHEFVVRQSNLTARGSGLQLSHRLVLSLLDDLEPVDQLLRCLSQYDRPAQLGIKPAQTIVLDQ